MRVVNHITCRCQGPTKVKKYKRKLKKGSRFEVKISRRKAPTFRNHQWKSDAARLQSSLPARFLPSFSPVWPQAKIKILLVNSSTNILILSGDISQISSSYQNSNPPLQLMRLSKWIVLHQNIMLHYVELEGPFMIFRQTPSSAIQIPWLFPPSYKSCIGPSPWYSLKIKIVSVSQLSL